MKVIELVKIFHVKQRYVLTQNFEEICEGLPSNIKSYFDYKIVHCYAAGSKIYVEVEE